MCNKIFAARLLVAIDEGMVLRQAGAEWVANRGECEGKAHGKKRFLHKTLSLPFPSLLFSLILSSQFIYEDVSKPLLPLKKIAFAS